MLFIRALILALVVTISSSVASAAPMNADVSVALTGPSSVPVNTPTAYTMTVANTGPGTAQGITARVTLPVTNTSPQVYVLGAVSSLSSGCSVVNREVVCTVASLKKGKTATFTYAYTAPIATKPLTMTATVATTGTNDPQTGNNTASFTPTLSYPARVITNGAVTNSHCTGQNLTSYFECTLFPSSISTHSAVFNGDNTITIPEPGFSGTWSQPTPQQLHFEYFDNGNKVLEFNGYATNGAACFDGISTFFPASQYMSPYHVCI